jgi:hypothetical protein
MRHLMQIGDEGARHRQINIYSIIQQMYQTCEHIAKATIVHLTTNMQLCSVSSHHQ